MERTRETYFVKVILDGQEHVWQTKDLNFLNWAREAIRDKAAKDGLVLLSHERRRTAGHFMTHHVYTYGRR